MIVIVIFGLSTFEFIQYCVVWVLRGMLGNVSNCVQSWHIVEELAVALRADKHRAQARFGEEGLGRGVRAARRISPRVQPGSLAIGV